MGVIFEPEPQPVDEHLSAPPKNGWRILIFLVAVAFGAAYRGKSLVPWVRARFYSSESRVAGNIVRLLAPDFADASSDGPTVTLPKDRIELIVSHQDEQDTPKGYAHFHVLAKVGGVPAAPLDFCLMGDGETHAAAELAVAKVFSDYGLPAMLSAIRHAAVLGATPFSGTETWGVPGFRGYASPLYQRFALGTGDDEEDEESIFAGVPVLPKDGRLHLLKAVALWDGGAWKWTFELDGQPLPGGGGQWKAPVAARILMVVRFAVFGATDTIADDSARASALKRVEAHGPWLFPADACPYDVMPAHFQEGQYSAEACRGGRLLSCVDECQAGSYTSCYSAALELERDDRYSAEVSALFLRACRLGFSSGCTNAASYRLHRTASDEACATNTFEATCHVTSDPWACTMFAGAIINGKGRPPDPVRARQVLGKSCRDGEDDPACVAAKKLLGQLDAAEKTNQTGERP